MTEYISVHNVIIIRKLSLLKKEKKLLTKCQFAWTLHWLTEPEANTPKSVIKTSHSSGAQQFHKLTKNHLLPTRNTNMKRFFCAQK